MAIERRGTKGFVYAVEATEPGEVDMIRAGVMDGRPMDHEPADLILLPACFSLRCVNCDAGETTEMDTKQKAIKAGWKDICFDALGMSWNYLGMCPDCVREDEAEIAAQGGGK